MDEATSPPGARRGRGGREEADAISTRGAAAELEAIPGITAAEARGGGHAHAWRALAGDDWPRSKAARQRKVVARAPDLEGAANPERAAWLSATLGLAARSG